MVRDDRASNLLFLLTLPLSMGCPSGEEDEDGTSSPTSVTPMTGGNDTESTGAVTTGAMTTDDGPTPTTDSSVDSTTAYATTGYDTVGYSCTDIRPPMVGPISQACMQYAALSVECYYDGDPECVPVAEAYCQYFIEGSTMAYGDACGMAFEELFVCLSMLTCEQLEDKMEDCMAEGMAVEMACMKM